MTIQKLLGLLFEHVEAGDISDIYIDSYEIIIDSGYSTEKTINLYQDLLQQYNKIFGYEDF